MLIIMFLVIICLIVLAYRSLLKKIYIVVDGIEDLATTAQAEIDKANMRISNLEERATEGTDLARHAHKRINDHEAANAPLQED